jgi:hypothetical protein
MQMSHTADCECICNGCSNCCSTQHLQPQTTIWRNDLAFLTTDRTIASRAPQSGNSSAYHTILSPKESK